MSDDLFALVGDDLNYLAGLIARTLHGDSDLNRAKQLLRALAALGSPGASAEATSDDADSLRSSAILAAGAADVLDGVAPGDHESLKTVVLLSVASDCLRSVAHAILADGQVNHDELRLAYTIVGPLAKLLAHSVDRHAHYADLEPENVVAFLYDFSHDSNTFGGGPGCRAAMCGCFLSTVVCVITGTSEALDRYEHVSMTVAKMIVQLGGLESSEQSFLQDARNFVTAMRARIPALRQLIS